MAIPKHVAYKTRVLCIEYDMKGMLDAYGLDAIIKLARMVNDGDIKACRDVQRWCADASLNAADNPVIRQNAQQLASAVWVKAKPKRTKRNKAAI